MCFTHWYKRFAKIVHELLWLRLTLVVRSILYNGRLHAGEFHI